VEARTVDTDTWRLVAGCNNPKGVTILIRGGRQRVIDEAERSMHHAIMVGKDGLERPAIVSGGAAIEEALSSRLMRWSSTLQGREALAGEKFAEALAAIPSELALNGGLDWRDTQ